MEVKMSLTKSTKGTHVYSADQDGAAIPSLYIKKDTLPTPPPQTITISVGF